MAYKVIHNNKEHRFEAKVKGYRALVEYQLLGCEIMNIYHTEVPEPIGEQGIGSAIMKEAFEFARRNHYQILPTCPFAQSYLEKHADYRNVLGYSNSCSL